MEYALSPTQFFRLYVMGISRHFIQLKFVLENTSLSLSIPVFPLDSLLSVNGASVSSVVSAAINSAPKVNFSYSKIKFWRNIGSTHVLRLWGIHFGLIRKSAIFFGR